MAAPFLSEAQLHKTAAQFLHVALPAEAVFHHSPNEGSAGAPRRRSITTGIQKGWPDIEIIWQGRAYFIELKSAKGRIKPDQARIHTRLWDAGAVVVVCRSLDAIERALRGWEMPLRTSLMSKPAEDAA